MRKTLLALLIVLTAAPAWAQKINLDFPAALGERATEVVDVTLDASMLKLAAKFLNGDEDERRARDVIRGLDGIYVRSYTFDHDGEYDRSLIEHVRSQLGPSWKRIVSVRSKTKDNTEVYIATRNDNPIGLVVIDAEPRELTVVNIVGPIDLDKLSSIEGQFGVPHFGHKDKEKGK